MIMLLLLFDLTTHLGVKIFHMLVKRKKNSQNEKQASLMVMPTERLPCKVS